MNYSVPYEYIKQKVDVRLTKSTVEVFFNGNRICSHPRLHGRPNQYSTVEAHMPAHHQKYMQWNGERFRRWATKIGENTHTVIDALLYPYWIVNIAFVSATSTMWLLLIYTHRSHILNLTHKKTTRENRVA